jgi:hypothetical protein
MTANFVERIVDLHDTPKEIGDYSLEEIVVRCEVFRVLRHELSSLMSSDNEQKVAKDGLNKELANVPTWHQKSDMLRYIAPFVLDSRSGSKLSYVKWARRWHTVTSIYDITWRESMRKLINDELDQVANFCAGPESYVATAMLEYIENAINDDDHAFYFFADSFISWCIEKEESR